MGHVYFDGNVIKINWTAAIDQWSIQHGKLFDQFPVSMIYVGPLAPIHIIS